MSKEKTSGFVYIWFDRKHKRYYIGSHWGDQNDGYICSSDWMKKAYKRRPDDFKRRILKIVITNRQDLLNEENRWLSMIKKEELKIRYYNHHNTEFGHWSTDEKRRAEIGQKISKTNKGMKIEFSDPVGRGQKIAEGKRKAFEKRKKETGECFSEEHREKLAAKKRGTTRSPEAKAKLSETLKNKYASGWRA